MFKSVKTSGKKILAGSMVLAALTAGMFASPVSSSTAGLFKSDSDNIQSVTEWSVVEFDKWMVSGDFDSGTTRIDVAGAFRIGDVFISPAYVGNFIRAYDSTKSTKTNTPVVLANGKVENTVKDEYIDYNNGTYGFYNKPVILVGFGNIGIKTSVGITTNRNDATFNPSSFVGNGETSTTTTVIDANGNTIKVPGTETTYDTGYANSDTIVPAILAGATFETGDITLKPEVGIGLSINKESKYAKRNVINKYKTGTDTTTTYEVNNYTYGIIPSLGIVAEIPSEKFTNILNLSYSGTFNVYDAKYSNAFGGEEKAATAVVTTTKRVTPKTAATPSSTEATEVQANTSEKQYMNNAIALGYTLSAPLTDRLTLKTKLGATVSLENKETKYKNISTENTVEKNVYGEVASRTENTSTTLGDDVTSFECSVSPVYTFAAEYAAVPGKLTVYGNASVYLPDFYYSETTTKDNGNRVYATTVTETLTDKTTTANNNGAVETSTTVEKSSSWSGLSAVCGLGMSWAVCENFIVDAKANLSIDSNGGSSVYNNGFINTINIGGTVKF